MVQLFKKLYWILADRCMACGGELFVWSPKKAECTECGKLDQAIMYVDTVTDSLIPSAEGNRYGAQPSQNSISLTRDLNN
jgi:hypothetical protein